MPELPEVEYTARQLRATIIGKTIAHVDVFWARSVSTPELPDFVANLENRRITAIRRRGKLLLLDLSGELVLSIHRRMTGNLLLLPQGWDIDTGLREADAAAWNTKGPTFYEIEVQNESCDSQGQDATVGVATRTVASTQTRYCRICLTFTDGERLLFTDPRKFGRVALFARQDEEVMLHGVGVEPLSESFTAEQFEQALTRRAKTNIKQALLAQELVAGIGNIYADEALYFAHLHPLRRVNTLNAQEIARLHEGIITVLTRGIEHGGTSFNDYRDLWGESGDNYNHVFVYHKDGTPCPNCGTRIERIIVGQRGTHFCPTCQPMTQ
ncbi:MAG TPA: hypothetical protein DHW02_23600 [Ktedonobacter sp.]|nr:hypothetical protein [Ktedonobacter sp.]